jgi:nucleotide-binding universal stress UspA family protein
MQSTAREESKPVVVAVDRQPESLHALHWAIEFAKTRRHPLRVIIASQQRKPNSDAAGSFLRSHTKAVRSSQALASEIEATVRDSGLSYEVTLVVGTTNTALRRHTNDAVLAVKGLRAATGWRKRLQRLTLNKLERRLGVPLLTITTPTSELTPKQRPPLSKSALETLIPAAAEPSSPARSASSPT